MTDRTRVSPITTPQAVERANIVDDGATWTVTRTGRDGGSEARTNYARMGPGDEWLCQVIALGKLRSDGTRRTSTVPTTYTWTKGITEADAARVAVSW